MAKKIIQKYFFNLDLLRKRGTYNKMIVFKVPLRNKGYSSIQVKVGEKIGNLIDTTFIKSDGTQLQIHAGAGL